MPVLSIHQYRMLLFVFLSPYQIVEAALDTPYLRLPEDDRDRLKRRRVHSWTVPRCNTTRKKRELDKQKQNLVCTKDNIRPGYTKHTTLRRKSQKL